MMLRLSRRAFLNGVGSLVVWFVVPGDGHKGRLHAQSPRTFTTMFNDRIELCSDGTVRLHIGRIEMGQGLYSAVTQLAAEELDLDMARIRIAPVDTESAPDEGFTDSSASMRGTGLAVRRAAAEARAVLLAMAARHLGISVDQLQVSDGVVQASGHLVTYWTLLASGSARASALPSARKSAAAPAIGPQAHRHRLGPGQRHTLVF